METVLQKYSRIGYFDFIAHFKAVEDFYKESFPEIVTFFKSKTGNFPREKIKSLEQLIKNQNIAVLMFRDFLDKEKEITMEHFTLQEVFDNFTSLIDFMQNVPKFLRVSKENVFQYKVPMAEYQVKQFDTLESIALKYFGNQEKWEEIAVQNNLSYFEVGDSNWVGRVLKIRLDLTTQIIPGIIDVPIAEDMLGKDICKEFEFLNDDIKTVSGDSCFEQSCIIMFNLHRGQIPENYNLGHVLNEVVGTNLQVFNNINVINEITNIFKIDPTVKDILLSDIEIEDDFVVANFLITSINGYQYNREKYYIKIN